MPFDHNDHYHRLLLRHVPPGARRALDVGCGTGRFARRLADRGIEVDAVDSSAAVIEAARPHSRVRFRYVDITGIELPAGRYDVISCLASLHHVPFQTVTALRAALAPGGVLVVLGCYREIDRSDLAVSLTAVPVNAAARLAVAVGERLTGRPREPRPPVAPPAMTLAEVRERAGELLPGAAVRRLLFWRYLLVHHEKSTGGGCGR